MATLRAILIGAVAALVAVLPAVGWRLMPHAPWFHPAVALAAVAAAAFLAVPWAGGTRYVGLPNLIQHAHLAPGIASNERWPRRALISWLLTIAGLPVGPEGAAAEAAQGLANGTRPQSSRWFEQYRRTDAATALASAISAAFGAPFAGILLPLELGIGGRVISAVTGALTAFVVSDVVRGLAGVPAARGGFSSLTEMSAGLVLRAAFPVLVTAALATAVALGLMVFASQARSALQGFAGRNARLAAAIGGGVALAVLLAYPPAQQPMSLTFARIFTAKQPMLPVSLLLLSLFLGWVALRTSIGALGVFWPLMTVGAACGAIAADLLEVSRALPVLAGAAAVWGAVLGAPLAAGVLAYELSGEITVLVAALVAGAIGRTAREWLAGDSLVERELGDLGIELAEGRSLPVLESLRVRQAMVSDYVAVGEHEPVSRLEKFLESSPYPFLVVVAANGRYVGLLTADVVHRASREELSQARSNVPLEQLLEAKDLLYRSGLRIRTVDAEDSLAVTVGLFESTPVVPVLGDQERALGLLFAHNVRIAYEQEVAKRSLFFRQPAADESTERIPV